MKLVPLQRIWASYSHYMGVQRAADQSPSLGLSERRSFGGKVLGVTPVEGTHFKVSHCR